MYEIWSITCHTILYNEKFLLPRKSTFSKSTSETQCAVDHMLICFPAGICIFKINNENSRAMREIFSKLKLKAPERQHSICYIIFWNRNFSQLYPKYFQRRLLVDTSFCWPYFKLWTDSLYYSAVSIIDFEQVNTG